MDTLAQIVRSIGTYVPNLIGALVILIVGWLVALAVAALVGTVLRRTTLDNRLGEWLVGKGGGKPLNTERAISKAVYYVLLLLVIIAFFDALRLQLITQPISRFLDQVLGYLPNLIGAIILLFVAWIVAKVLQLITVRVIRSTKLDQRLGSRAGLEVQEQPERSAAKTVGDIVYWLVFLLFLPAILGALGLGGLLVPVQNMITGFLGYFPNLVAAALILFFGWIVARIVQRLVSSLLAAIGVDRFSERFGLSTALGSLTLSGLIGLLIYIMVLIPVTIAALNALNLQSLTVPASNMLNMILSAIPLIFTAALVLIVGYIIARGVASITTRFLTGIGFNAVLGKIGLSSVEPHPEARWTPSSLVGFLVFVSIMLFALIEAAQVLQFGLIANVITQFMIFAGHIILGLVIFGIGLYLARVAAAAVAGSDISYPGFLALVTRIAVIIFAAAIGLRQMGLADEIINLAFGLLLGAIAVAAAIAFGIGGRQIAGHELEEWVNRMRSERGEHRVPPAERPAPPFERPSRPV